MRQWKGQRNSVVSPLLQSNKPFTIERSKHAKQNYNDETKTWKPVLDENGNQVYTHRNDAVATMEERIYPLLNELVEAFGVKDDRL